MKKICKSILSIMLVASLIIVFSVPVNSQEISTTRDICLETYVNGAVPRLLTSSGIDINKPYLSQGYNVNYSNTSHQRIYFVFDNTICLGYISVTDIDNNYSSSFIAKQLDCISTSVCNKSLLSLFVYDEMLMASIDNQPYILYGKPKNDFEIDLSQLNLTYFEQIQLSSIVINTDLYPHSPAAANAPLSLNDYLCLDVPYVANQYCHDIQNYLCWAASISSIGAYYQNDSTPMSALQLYYALNERYSDDFGPIVGDDFGLQIGFTYFGINYNYWDCPLTFSKVTSVLESGKPILIGIGREGGAHTLVICGYRTLSSGYYKQYIVLDSNTETLAIIDITNGYDNFVYSPSYTYTKWLSSIY